MFDPAAGDTVEASIASRAVWFDAFVTNVDRTARNPNLLYWHKTLYFIDHGAALYFHHNWQNVEQAARSPFAAVREHVLLPWADRLREADAELRPRLGEAVFERVLGLVPDDWLELEPGIPTPAGKRAAYVAWLQQRLEAAPLFTEEAARARAQL